MGILDNLPHTCIGKRRVREQGTLAGGKDSFTTTFTDRACWRQPLSDSEILEFNKRDIEVSHKIFFTSDPGLDERDVIVIGSDVMEVRAVSHQDASVGLGIVWRLIVKLKKL